jgi:hypothetical protein
MSQIQLVGNSLPIIVADDFSLSTGVGTADILLQSNSPVYMKSLAKNYSLQYFSQSNMPIVACSSLLKSWTDYGTDISIIHAGCAELVPIDKTVNLGWLWSIYDHLNPSLIDSIYFSETIRKYINKNGNEAYMTEGEFLESCQIALVSLMEIWWTRKIIVGICYVTKDDWRYSYMEKADQIMKKVFGHLYYIDLFREDLFYLVGTDGIHLTKQGHDYIYNLIKERCGL